MSVLLPDDPSASSFIGILQVFGRQYPIQLATDPVGFECDPALARLLQPVPHALGLIRDRIRQHGRRPPSLETLLEIQDIAERVVGCKAADPEADNDQVPSGEFYETIVKELGLIGWDRVVTIHPSLTQLDLKTCDSNHRQHFFTIRLRSDYPLSSPDCSLDIPYEFQLSWNKRFSLQDAIKQIKTELEKYEPFWEVLDDFDQNCSVIEPTNPSRSSRSRRLALDRYSSLLVDINPAAPRRLCDCRFLGPDAVINPLKDKLVLGVAAWRPDISPRQNLETILGVEFPKKRASSASDDNDDFFLECGICYARERDAVVADRICEEGRCARPFHNACLVDWLTAIPNCRRSFNTVFGICPYCSTPITATL